MFVASTSVQCVREIMNRIDIPYGHKAMMVAIAMNHDYKHSCEVGVETLRAQAGMSARTAYRALKRMEELGFITKERSSGRAIFRNSTCGWGEMER